MKGEYVLWLPSWYPNKINQFDGDFIERHAVAVSAYKKLIVLVVIKDPNQKKKGVIIEKDEQRNITTYKAYYDKRFNWIFLEQLFSFISFIQIQKKLFKQIVEENGLPKLAHVHVAMKAGLLAIGLKKKFKIPYVVTEHWSGYRPEATPNIYSGNMFFRKLNQKILMSAEIFLPVSKSLGEIINQYFISIPFRVISNVVNTHLFFFNKTEIKKFRFIHVSSMNFNKNPEGILHACNIVKEKGYEFELLMVGNQSEELICLAKTLKISDIISIENAVPYNEVANLMQQASSLLMFSRFENLPCVILEALCCGIPVISSNVGGVSEIIDKQNGILVNSNDVESLAIAMIEMIENYSVFDKKEISAKATQLYSYNKVATEYLSIYNEILAGNALS